MIPSYVMVARRIIELTVVCQRRRYGRQPVSHALVVIVGAILPPFTAAQVAQKLILGLRRWGKLGNILLELFRAADQAG